jgi:spore coat protein CotH
MKPTEPMKSMKPMEPMEPMEHMEPKQKNTIRQNFINACKFIIMKEKNCIL